MEAKTKWALDPTHSELLFKVKHMMISNVTGHFSNFNVIAETNGDSFEHANVSFSAQIDSVNTRNEQRDGHLKGADFFDSANHPEMIFETTETKALNGNGDYEVIGKLNLKGITKDVVLSAHLDGIAKDPWGNTKAGLSIQGKINRQDFGLTWNSALETGGVLVSDEVNISAEIQLIKQ